MDDFDLLKTLEGEDFATEKTKPAEEAEKPAKKEKPKAEKSARRKEAPKGPTTNLQLRMSKEDQDFLRAAVLAYSVKAGRRVPLGEFVTIATSFFVKAKGLGKEE